MIRRVQFRFKSLLLLIAGVAALVVAAQIGWRQARTDMAWRSFPRAGELNRLTSGTLLNPQFEIDISDNPNLRDRDLATLAGLSTIQRLDASNTPLTDQCLADLQSLRSLKSLDISGTGISQRAADALEQSLPDCSMHD